MDDESNKSPTIEAMYAELTRMLEEGERLRESIDSENGLTLTHLEWGEYCASVIAAIDPHGKIYDDATPVGMFYNGWNLATFQWDNEKIDDAENRRRNIQGFVRAVGALRAIVTIRPSSRKAQEPNAPRRKNNSQATTPEPIETRHIVDVFISYSTADKEVAEDLANRLRALQLKVFMAHDTIRTGPTWRLQVGVALRACKVAILLLSRRSLQSDWVRYEIGAIWALKKPAAPALLDCSVNDIPELVREFQSRSISTPSERAIFCYEVERLVRAEQAHGEQRLPCSEIE